MGSIVYNKTKVHKHILKVHYEEFSLPILEGLQ